ncbi:MAG TPA: hypothetical protein DEA71_18585 [Nitrospira sp.]|nr:hypothetical protein [Nitrospira sp.]
MRESKDTIIVLNVRRKSAGPMSLMTVSRLGTVLIGLVLVLAAGASAGVFAEETVAERFSKAMKKKADYCRTHKIAPANRRCDILKLKPADPLATEEGRFAHSIKIPNPVPEDSGYKPGMTPEQYFDHLCKTEAGEFIYKTVENVEGLYMMRPREEATDDELSHLYALEDPYGQVLGEDRKAEDSYVQPAIGKYSYLELPQSSRETRNISQAPYKRYYRDENAHPRKDFQTAINGQFVRVPYIVAQEEIVDRKSRFAYTWRGLARPHDRELGIAGGELIVLNLETREILAVRRGYIRSGWMKNLTGIWWLTARVCPGSGSKREHLFVKEILKPAATTSVIKER